MDTASDVTVTSFRCSCFVLGAIVQHCCSISAERDSGESHWHGWRFHSKKKKVVLAYDSGEITQDEGQDVPVIVIFGLYTLILLTNPQSPLRLKAGNPIPFVDISYWICCENGFKMGYFPFMKNRLILNTTGRYGVPTSHMWDREYVCVGGV